MTYSLKEQVKAEQEHIWAVQEAVYAAELVLPFLKSEEKMDILARNAINAMKDWIKVPTEQKRLVIKSLHEEIFNKAQYLIGIPVIYYSAMAVAEAIATAMSIQPVIFNSNRNLAIARAADAAFSNALYPARKAASIIHKKVGVYASKLRRKQEKQDGQERNQDCDK